MANIMDGIYGRDRLWSNNNGRDYIKIGDEVFSINGLYCDQHGKPERWGKHVKIMDIRWVVVSRDHDGTLRYRGDARDRAALEHWGIALD